MRGTKRGAWQGSTQGQQTLSWCWVALSSSSRTKLNTVAQSEGGGRRDGFLPHHPPIAHTTSSAIHQNNTPTPDSTLTLKMLFSTLPRALLLLILTVVILADSTTSSAVSQTTESQPTSTPSIAYGYDQDPNYTFQGCFNETTMLNVTGNKRALSGGQVRLSPLLYHSIVSRCVEQ